MAISCFLCIFSSILAASHANPAIIRNANPTEAHPIAKSFKLLAMTSALILYSFITATS